MIEISNLKFQITYLIIFPPFARRPDFGRKYAMFLSILAILVISLLLLFVVAGAARLTLGP